MEQQNSLGDTAQQLACGTTPPNCCQHAASSRKLADRWGILCSASCAIHCAITPLLLVALPTIPALSFLADPLVHQVAAVVCVALVIEAILPRWHYHRNWLVVTLANSGLAMLLISAFLLPDQCCQTARDLPILSSQVAAAERPAAERPAESIFTATATPTSSLTLRLASWSAANEAETLTQLPQTHRQPWGRSLLTETQLRSVFGPWLSQFLLAGQPFFSPLGGLLLILAHWLNLRSAGSFIGSR
ncbi:MerC domain-containing protein [Planctomycetaceae bacterium SH139]